LGFTHLNNLADHSRSTLWSQGWTDANRLGLNEEEKLELERYIFNLKSSQIRLTDCEDELIWDLAPSGIYSPKLGYLKYNSDLGLRSLFGGGENYGRSKVWQKQDCLCGMY
jgi:hypothetical protein